ncbi:hypothetical protein [uncultured Parasphingorhabdus sp.]|uniref:hypothetical protein n=1 Tax=uncultured Parasphingorhabdus sp. TaxID=2709694 RepID=UPI002AA86B2D|nr:hypothetical protein [uncultured Parasphingorhabdus sp.]
MTEEKRNARQTAAAQAMDAAGKEIAAIVAERIFAADKPDGAGIEAVGGLLSAAYHLALVLDGPAAKPGMATLLRNFADTIEKSA